MIPPPPPLFSSLGKHLREPVITDLMTRVIDDPELLSLAAGFTDTSTLPAAMIGQAVQSILNRPGPPESLQYGPNQGRAGLREAITRLLSAQPGEVDGTFLPELTLVTNGSQQALYLAIQTLCDPGDIVLVEDPTYFVFLEMLRGMGVEARAIPCHEDGAPDLDRLDAFRLELEKEGVWQRVKVLYLVSYFSNPSSRSLKAHEKDRLGQWISEAGHVVALIEDAAYRDLYFGATPWPTPSGLAFPWASRLPVLYLGTLDKPFAAGLKVGFAVANEPTWLARMCFAKGHQDFGSAHFPQAILETLLINDDYSRHVEPLRRHYETKAQITGEALSASGLADYGWIWNQPAGGLYFWLRGPEEADTRLDGPLASAALDRHVIYVPGDLCHASGTPWNHIRLSFGNLDRTKLPEAVHRLAEAIKHCST